MNKKGISSLSLSVAYVLIIHKSQASTLDKAVFNIIDKEVMAMSSYVGLSIMK